MQVSVRAEWDRLKTVALHRPGMEIFFGLLVPYASLYERLFSREGAVAEHRRLEEILRDEFHVRVISVRETITAAADTSPAFRDRLVQQSRKISHSPVMGRNGGLPPSNLRKLSVPTTRDTF
jgi:arginine deiminase